MTKEDCLEIIKLLSAIESWMFSVEKRVPDYLHDSLTNTVEALSKEILK